MNVSTDCPLGVEAHFVDNWQTRPIVRPRGLLIHTNGASVESTLAAQLRWSNAAHDNTKPHYVVDRKGAAWKTLPSDRQGIANYQADKFFLSIETTDLGWPVPGPACGFSPEQAETVARIVAWESELWDFPIVTPTRWDGSGVAAHTDPFTYPYWTKYQGKACPGTQKKIEVRSIILPRANAIRHPVVEPSPPEPAPITGADDMPALPRIHKVFDSRDLLADGRPAFNEGKGIPTEWRTWLNLGHPEFTSARIVVSVINPATNGFLMFWDGAEPDPSMGSMTYDVGRTTTIELTVPVVNGQVYVRSLAHLEALVVGVSAGGG